MRHGITADFYFSFRETTRLEQVF